MKFSSSLFTPLALLLCSGSHVANALDLDLNSTDSIKSVAATIAYDMMTYYKGNLSGNTPGLLPGPPPNPSILNAGYFWWEAGGMFGCLMDYWYYTGDTSYNDVVMQGMQFQVGDNKDYLPANQTNGMGNDDQGFWGMSAMNAAELGFPDPPAGQPQWVALAQAVFNTQVVRLDNLCNGGLHWQAYTFLNGYNYKNSISNGCFFNIAARLAQYTGNATYAQYATQTWEWMTSVGFMDAEYNIYDGAHTNTNCTDINPIQYSYNAGIFLLGAAVMYNYTNGSTIWQDRVNNLLNSTLRIFFPDDIGYEVACETNLTCTVDMYSQKAFLTRFMAATTKVAPWTYDSIIQRLRTSAAAAALQCSGGDNGRMCGLSWYKKSVWDGTSGVGQQMAAMEVIASTLIQEVKAPVTGSTGGTSQGDPNAGTTNNNPNSLPSTPATTGDKAGAGILTAVVLCGLMGGLSWMSF